MGANFTTDELHRLDKQMMHLKDMVYVGSRSYAEAKAAVQAGIDGKHAEPGTAVPEPNISNAYPLTIDYTQSLEQMVSAGGYNYPNPDITAGHYPVEEGEGNVEALLVHFNREIESDEVLAELDGWVFVRLPCWNCAALVLSIPNCSVSSRSSRSVRYGRTLTTATMLAASAATPSAGGSASSGTAIGGARTAAAWPFARSALWFLDSWSSIALESLDFAALPPLHSLESMEAAEPLSIMV